MTEKKRVAFVFKRMDLETDTAYFEASNRELQKAIPMMPTDTLYIDVGEPTADSTCFEMVREAEHTVKKGEE